MINTGGGDPIPDRFTVSVEPPTVADAGQLTGGPCVHVADVHATYQAWTARGARFLSPPVDFSSEIRCYPLGLDGYLSEVGQKKGKWDDGHP